MIFDPQAPVFRFLKTGEAAKGDLNLQFEGAGTTEQPQDVRVQVTARDPHGAVLYTDTQQQTLKRGERKAFTFQKHVTWAEGGGNRLDITATERRRDADTGQEVDVVLYDVQLPVKSLVSQTEWASRVLPWLQQKPKSGIPAWKFAYWASYGMAEASLDLDFFGMDEAKKKATAFTLTVESPTGHRLASQTAPVANLAGRMLMPVGDLPDGEYRAHLQVFGADGKTPVYDARQEFRRKHYPWEGNTLGKEDVLLPPYTPITVEQKDAPVVKPCLREYTLGGNGLPAQIRAAGGAGWDNLLTAPIAFELQEGEHTVTSTGSGMQVLNTSPTQVSVTSHDPLTLLPATLKADMAFDGWWDVTLTIPPAAGRRLDRLTLVIPVWNAADTLYVQRGADSFAGANTMGAIPAGDGVVWDSGKLNSDKHLRTVWGTFAPVAYVGNGDKGVWWLAEENRDWTRADGLPAIQYVRTAHGVELHINILAAATPLDRERTLHFALLADPVKKMPDTRKWAWSWGNFEYAHEGFGWREWGHSHDGYYMTDDDRAKLHDALMGTRPFAVPTGGFAEAAIRMSARGGKTVLYGSTANMMLDLPEFDTFSGEWLGSSFIPAPVKAPKAGKPNLQGSYDCGLASDSEEIGCNWTPSQVDCFIWYHEKLLRTCPVNGTWWDNSSNFEIRDYDPVRKEFYYKWNVFTRRQLCRRLNTLGWALNRPPWWINNVHVDWSFNQVSWHIENDYYVDGPGNTLLDQMTVDNFRAYARLKQGIIHRLASRYGGSDTCTVEERRRRSRSTIGLCLLHDIGSYLWDDYAIEYHTLPELLNQSVGFFTEEDRCEFIGYWRSAPYVKVETPEVYVSVYRNHADWPGGPSSRAVLVLLNGRKEARDVKLTVLDTLLGHKPRKFTDLERNASFGGYGSYEQPNLLGLEPYGLRFIQVE